MLNAKSETETEARKESELAVGRMGAGRVVESETEFGFRTLSRSEAESEGET